MLQEQQVDLQESQLNNLDYAQRLSDLTTKREKEILVLVASGKTNKEISSQLQLSTSTVRNHISRIFKKLNISSRVQATLLAIQGGLLNLSITHINFY